MENLRAISLALRMDIINTIYRAKAGHIGGDLSVTDILVTLYYKHLNISPQTVQDPKRDRFVLSKGHCVEALYAVLAGRGFLPREDLGKVYQFGSPYIGHPSNKIPGIEMNSGSLGHGLSVCVGMALAGKLDKADYRVYTVMGDGELAEGSVWEGVMAASHYKLDNLCAVVDRNGLQISGTTETVMSQGDLASRWSSFGWNVIHVNGHDIDSLDAAFVESKAHKGTPSVIIADTVKGYGVSFMENNLKWHHRAPTEAEYLAAMNELEQRRLAVS